MTLGGKTVLVTGATGFLGGTLAARLVHDGARVRGLARSAERARHLPPGVEPVIGDITRPETLAPAPTGCDVVFHCAIHYGSLTDQQRVNVEGTRYLLEAAANTGVRRFVQISSIAAYGYEVRGDVFEDHPLTGGQDAYSLTKASAERVVRDVAAARGLSFSLIRPGMIYGPGSIPWTKLLFRVSKLRPMPFVGDGSGASHPVYVDDVVDLMTLIGWHPAAEGEAFNCTPDPAPTWRAWLTEYQRLLGRESWLAVPPGVVRLLAAPVALARHFSDEARAFAVDTFVNLLQARYTYRMDKARDRLGWAPRVDLETGVRQCAPWLREIGLLR